VKTVEADGRITLADGRTLDPTFREFQPGYAITSYGSQGKTVDYVLFSDSAVKAATNAQQWYVSISQCRYGIRIFTPDKDQLRENVIRSGHRPLALDLIPSRPSPKHRDFWNIVHGYMQRFGKAAADRFVRVKYAFRRRNHQQTRIREHQTFRMLDHRPSRSRHQSRSVS